MAILGHGGRLLLRREAPDPTVVRPGNIAQAVNSIYMRNPAFWSGDYVNLSCPEGLPLGMGGPGSGPSNPNGYAMYYGSEWYLGANKAHIADEADRYFTDDDTDDFYMTPEVSGFTTSAEFYIYRDKLDRLSFYDTRSKALNGRLAERYPVYKVDFSGLVVSAAGTTEYANAIAACLPAVGEYQYSDVQDEISLESICEFAPTYEAPPAWITEYDNADLTPRYFVNAGPEGVMWLLQANLKEWTLNLDAPEVDTTAVGERFGDAVKSMVSGGGTIDFIVERENRDEESKDSTALMRLVLLTEKGCKADAEFWMINNRPDTNSFLLPGDLYYESQLLVTSIAINTRADDIIAGSLNFVTVGEIALRMGTN